jgi:hypothetical protein
MDTKQLLHFMRETIRLRRAPGESMPWTSDPILGEWSFTKVKREDDRVPRWIAVSWREPQSRSVFFMTVARSVNCPATYARSAIRCPSGYGGVCRPRRPALRRRLYDPGGQQNLS